MQEEGEEEMTHSVDVFTAGGKGRGGLRLMCDCNVCVCIYASVSCVVGVSVCIVE